VTALDLPLAELASFHGVETSYTDVDGVTRSADPATVLALLQALGVPLQHAREASALLRDQRIGALRRQLEPVLVYRIGRQEPVRATLPEGADQSEVWLGLELMDGTTIRSRLSTAVTGTPTGKRLKGAPYERVQIDLDTLCLGGVPAGYHHLTLEGAGVPETALVIAAPDCPRGPRQWGAFLPVHAIRSKDDWGAGSYSDLARLGDWADSLGAGLVGTLPLYPAFLDPPADPSPYLPVSRLAYNEFFIDPTALPEYAATPEARAAAPPARLRDLRATAFVQYEEVARVKRDVLEPMARALCAGVLPERRRGLDEFAKRQPELVAYARFRAARESGGRNGEPEPGTVGFHLYCQWAAFEQLAAARRSVGHYADFPVGTHPHGFDPVWSPSSFVPRVHGGAPPDRFFAGGQDWGFRPLHPERIREDGYHYLSAALRRAFRHADCLRIDHVMGLQRLYMIPEGRAASDGAYVAYRAEELHALVALEAHRAGAVVVGEDLGTVPPGVRCRMQRDRMLRSWVFQFESTSEDPLPQPPADVLASLGTHDLPRFGDYLWGEDIAERATTGALGTEDVDAERADRQRWRRRLLKELDIPLASADEERTTELAQQACLGHLARSEAPIVLVDLEEMWDERQPQNRPGTVEGNWRRRSARILEDLVGDVGLTAELSALTAERSS
jgi:4-alpha-glucanotransferase